MATTHQELVRSLDRTERLSITERSDAKGLVQLGLHFGLLAGLWLLIATGSPGWPWLLLPTGILLVFLFTAEHEAVHRTAFRTAWLNRAVAAVSGFLVLVPAIWFRHFHLAHHRWTQDPARDPELSSPKPDGLAAYLVYLTGLPLWTSLLRTLLVNASGRGREAFVPDRDRAEVTREARIHLALYALLAIGSVATGSTLLLWLWVVPALLGQPFLRAYLLAEHTGCPLVANMLANSRTTLTTALVRRLAWNMPYHAEHHAYPAVPFHALPRLHRLVRGRLETTERGYTRFHRRLIASLSRS